MTRFTSASLLILCVSLSMCRWAAAATPVLEDFSLKISRMGCEGVCPIYSVTLNRRGEVCWDGQNFVRTRGVAKKTSGPTQVQTIIQQIRDLKILSFHEAGRLSIDTPAVQIAITLDGRSVSVTHDSDSQQTTREGRAIASFARYAENVIGTERWISAVNR